MAKERSIVKPDLSCSIKAVGPEGQTIDDGGSVASGPDGSDVQINFVVTNPSSARSGQFWLRPCVRINGEKAYDPPVEMINLEPGGSWTHEFSGRTGAPVEEWRASLLADINDFVDESNERNNQAVLSFTTRASGA